MRRKPVRRAKYIDPPVMLTVRMTRAEYAALQGTAIAAGQNMNEWARRLLFGAAGVPLEGARRKGGWPLGRRRGNGPAPSGAVDCQDDELRGAAPQAPRIAQDGPAAQSGRIDGPERPDAA